MSAGFLTMSDAIHELQETVARLRSPDGCPWDREQTHQSLAACLVEECSELLDTLDREDVDHMREELGDVLLQVVMHAQLAAENAHFDLDRVAREANEKLIRRHPHVFGDQPARNATEALKRWNEMKREERKNSGGVAGQRFVPDLPPRIPALHFANKVFMDLLGADIEIDRHLKAHSIRALGASLDEDQAGALLFEISAACRHAQIDPEAALRRYTRKLVERIKDEVGE